jgi:hypothetical protein
MIVPDEDSCQYSGREGSDPCQIGPLAVLRRSRRFNDLTLSLRTTSVCVSYINHIDTPPNAARRGIQRNVMTGTLPAPDNGNVMKFTWVAEPSPTQTGEIVMIGPIR